MRFALVLALLVALTGSIPVHAAVEPSNMVETPLLIRFHAGASADDRLAAVRSVGGYIETEIRQLGVTRVVVPASDSLSVDASPLEIVSRHPAVEWAEPDSTVRLTFEPDDEHYLSHPAATDGQWGIKKAFVDKAWDTVRGSRDVVVAVMDTGVDPTHPDLIGALVDGNTFVTRPDDECTKGTTRDDNSHGTHVAGIIGATGDNGVGVAGVAFGVKVMPVKVLDCTGQGSLSDVANGLVWAVDNGAKVVNLSLGSTSDSSTLRSAVAYAAQRHVLVVSASGNCGTSGDKCLNLNQTEYPAAYDDVLAVSATDTDDTIAFFSTRNATVDVAAPGRRIISTTPTYATYLSQRETNPASLEYAVFSGTSQAAPFAAGLAALVWSAEPELTRAEVIERIRSTSDDLGRTGRDDSFGDGRVNALKAVVSGDATYAVEYEVKSVPAAATAARSFLATLEATNKSSFEWAARGSNAVSLQWTWLDASGAAVAELSGTIPLSADVEIDETATLIGPVTVPAAPGAYMLRFDLIRGTVAFSQRGADTLALPVVVGTGLGAEYEAPAGSTSFDAGSAAQIEITVRNSGTVAWSAAGPTPIKLSYHWLLAGAVVTWDGLRADLAADVAPGARVTLKLPVLPPSRPGPYVLRVDLVQEGVGWLSGMGSAPLDIEAGVLSGYVATYALGTPPILLPGGRAEVPVTVTNTGSATWPAGGTVPVRIAAHVFDRTGAAVLWDGERTLLASDVAAGQKVETTVAVNAPLAAGSYRVAVDAVREGVSWFSGLGVAAGEMDLLVVADYRAELPTGPLTVSQADPRVDVLIRNIGIATWTLGGASQITVSAHWYDAAGNVLVWDGPRTPIPAALASGGQVTLKVDLGKPPEGAASVTIDLVSEGLRWFGAGLRRPVTLGP